MFFITTEVLDQKINSYFLINIGVENLGNVHLEREKQYVTLPGCITYRMAQANRNVD